MHTDLSGERLVIGGFHTSSGFRGRSSVGAQANGSLKVPRLFAEMAFLGVNRHRARYRCAATLTTIFVRGEAEQTLLADRFRIGIKQDCIAYLTDARKKCVHERANGPNNSVQSFVNT